MIRLGVSVGVAYFVGSAVADAVSQRVAEGSRNERTSDAVRYGTMAAVGILTFVVVGKVLS